jgi:hypothetical protein
MDKNARRRLRHIEMEIEAYTMVRERILERWDEPLLRRHVEEFKRKVAEAPTGDTRGQSLLRILNDAMSPIAFWRESGDRIVLLKGNDRAKAGA